MRSSLNSLDAGFDKFWRFNHPQDSYHEGHENYLRGSHHIGCSTDHQTPWLFVLGAEALSTKFGVQKVKQIVFNRVHEQFIELTSEKLDPPITFTEDELLPGTYKIQKGGGKCYATHPDDFEKLVKLFADVVPV